MDTLKEQVEINFVFLKKEEKKNKFTGIASQSQFYHFFLPFSFIYANESKTLPRKEQKKVKSIKSDKSQFRKM